MPDTTLLRAAILAGARSHLGAPYAMPPGPGQFDCSWLVATVLDNAGAGLGAGVRTAEQQRRACLPIPRSDLLPGDLVFFKETYDATEAPGPDGLLATHVGFYIGGGRMLDANDARGNVGETDFETAWWRPHFLAAGRPPVLAGAVTPPTGGTVTLPPLPKGIDVASYQRDVDWQAVAASGIAFAFTKFTEDAGSGAYLNPYAASSWKGIKAAGLARGAYHYARPGADDADDEARYFLDRIDAAGGLETGDLLALDIESGSGDLGGWTLEFLRTVERHAGFKPLVYTGAWFSDPHELDRQPALADFGLWLAAYQSQMPAPPAPWPFVAFWQHSSTGRVPGVVGDCDLNVFNGPVDRIRLYGKPGGTVVAPDPPTPIAELAALRKRVGGLETAVYHLADVVVTNAARGARMTEEALAEAKRIREQVASGT